MYQSINEYDPSKPTVYVDAGHGGFDHKGRYTTNASSGKLFEFKSPYKGLPYSNLMMYEGFWNRVYAQDFVFRSVEHFNVVVVYDYIKDISLSQRCLNANEHYNTHKPKDSIFISFHSNAFNSKATGWSIFCHPNSAEGKKYAYDIATLYESLALEENTVIRVPSKSQNYWTEKFTVLSSTKMPAVLIENLFFDNLIDANKIMSPSYMARHNDCIIYGIRRKLNLF